MGNLNHREKEDGRVISHIDGIDFQAWMAKSNYSALRRGGIDIAWEKKMGIGSKSEFVSEKGFGPVSKIRPALWHWLCFDWIHPLLMLFTYSPPSYCPCLDSKFHFQQNMESVGSMKFASHLNSDDGIPHALLQAAFSPLLLAPSVVSLTPVSSVFSVLVKWVMALDQPWVSAWH